jgi:hypothetical protein
MQTTNQSVLESKAAQHPVAAKSDSKRILHQLKQ